MPTLKPTCRGWVMITRNRSDNGNFFKLDEEMETLVQDNNAVFKKSLVVYGNYDIVVPVECNDLLSIHDAVSTIQARGEEALFSTITYVAVNPSFANKRRYRKKFQVCIGIMTQPGRQVDVRNALERIKGFDLADVVLGEYDVIALFNPEKLGALDVIRRAIRSIPHIQKTTTMLPMNIVALYKS